MTRLLTLIALCVAVFFAFPVSGAKHESWVEVRSANFIVVSNAGEKQARKTAIRFEQIRAVFRQSIAVASAHPSPAITILAVKDEDSMRALLPEYWAKGHSHPAGIFVENLNQYFALVQLDAPGSNPYNTIYHEYYHSLTLPYFPNLPLWVAEGLAEFWGNTEVSESGTKMGEADADLIEELKQSSLIPLDVLFKVDQGSPYYNEDHKTSIFYAESWALIHYLMIGDKAAHRPALQAYLDALSHGASQDQAAAKAFGDLQKLQNALSGYVRNQSFYYLKSPAPPEIPASDLQISELSDAEADAYRGGFCAVAGKTQAAKPLLEDAVKLDPKLALGYQYLGFAEYQDGQKSEALADFTRAIELDPKNALTRYLRAYLASTQAGTIGNDQQLEEDLRAAIA
ncbi:MAG: tetratricopeptide repeat protein, partial [Candidatus Acidiferrales bacterium]